MILGPTTFDIRNRGPVMAKGINTGRWERMRKLGKWTYIFLIGMLGYGGIMFVISLLVNGFYLSWKEESRTTMILISLGIWAVAGAFLGFLTWYINERNYKKRSI